MQAYANEPTIAVKYGKNPERLQRLINGRRSRVKSKEFQAEFTSIISTYFNVQQMVEFEEILEDIQDVIDELAPLMGNFDPATETYKQPPESLVEIGKLISEWNAETKGNTFFAKVRKNLTRHEPQEKFRLLATYFYNYNDYVNDEGDDLIARIANLCLEGVKAALS